MWLTHPNFTLQMDFAKETNRPKATCLSLLFHAKAMCAHARLPNDGPNYRGYARGQLDEAKRRWLRHPGPGPSRPLSRTCEAETTRQKRSRKKKTNDAEKGPNRDWGAVDGVHLEAFRAKPNDAKCDENNSRGPHVCGVAGA